MTKIIYIAGLGHSGSTLLDMSLGTLAGVVGLGEVKTILDRKTRERHYNSICSCGKQAGDCPVWGELHPILETMENERDKIEALLELLRVKYGENVVLVDSSKNSYPYLEYLSQSHELKLVYLTRDIRSWSYSRHQSTGKPVSYFALRWILENIKLIRRIRKMNIPRLTIGYEELALYPEKILPGIADYLSLPYSDSMLVPGKSHSHIISGNVARTDALKLRGWIYDARWLLSRRMFLLAPLFLIAFRMNRNLVYQNVHGGSKNDFYLFGIRRRKEIAGKVN